MDEDLAGARGDEVVEDLLRRLRRSHRSSTGVVWCVATAMLAFVLGAFGMCITNTGSDMASVLLWAAPFVAVFVYLAGKNVKEQRRVLLEGLAHVQHKKVVPQLLVEMNLGEYEQFHVLRAALLRS